MVGKDVSFLIADAAENLGVDALRMAITKLGGDPDAQPKGAAAATTAAKPLTEKERLATLAIQAMDIDGDGPCHVSPFALPAPSAPPLPSGHPGPLHLA